MVLYWGCKWWSIVEVQPFPVISCWLPGDHLYWLLLGISRRCLQSGFRHRCFACSLCWCIWGEDNSQLFLFKRALRPFTSQSSTSSTSRQWIKDEVQRNGSAIRKEYVGSATRVSSHTRCHCEPQIPLFLKALVSKHVRENKNNENWNTTGTKI